MKKLLIIMLVTILTVSSIYAQDADNESEQGEVQQHSKKEKKSKTSVKPSVNVSDENWVYLKKNDTTGNQDFDKYRNRINAKGGVKIKCNDIVTVTPYVHFKDINLQTTSSLDLADTISGQDKIKTKEAFLNFKDAALHIGVETKVNFCDYVSLNATLYQWDYFKRNDPAWVGLGGSLGFDFEVERAFFDAFLWDQLSVRFKNEGTQDSLMLNLFDYGFRFNMFNFINEKTNTGIYGEGEFEMDLSCSNIDITDNYLYNEFYFGIISTPLSFMELWTALAIFAEGNYYWDGVLKDNTGKFEIGMQTGIKFFYNGFTFKFYYEPIFGSFLDAADGNVSSLVFENQGMNQKVKFQVSYKL